MAQSEKGNEKNFASFKTLNTFITGMNKDYQPTNPLTALSNVQNIITKGNTIIESIREVTFPVYSKAVDDQELAFKKLPSLTTCTTKAFKAAHGYTQTAPVGRLTNKKESRIQDDPPTAKKSQTHSCQTQTLPPKCQISTLQTQTTPPTCQTRVSKCQTSLTNVKVKKNFHKPLTPSPTFPTHLILPLSTICKHNLTMNIIITGASKGLGAAISQKFATDNHSHTFFLCARNQPALEEAANQLLQNRPQHQIRTYPCDMSQKKEALAFSQFILKQTNNINILINNTGSFIPGGILNEEDNTLENVMNTNLYSAYYLTKALLPAFIKNKNGHIFNICSTAALEAYPAGAAYSISKWAMQGFSKNLREALKPHGIKVTTVYPGSFYSDSWKGSGIDPERIMETTDIAEMIYTAAHLSPQACVEDIILRPQLGNV